MNNLTYINIAAAQPRLRTGDLEGNTKEILNQIKSAKQQNVHILCFPETAITGYCCGEKFDRPKFIMDQYDYLQKIIQSVPENMVVCIGYVEMTGADKLGFPVLYNSCCLIQNQKIIFNYRKVLLANKHHHEDNKYFHPGSIDQPSILKNVSFVNTENEVVHLNIMCRICEDLWTDDHEDSENLFEYSEEENVMTDVLLVPNQSYFCYDKLNARLRLLDSILTKYNIKCVVYSNPFGVGDIVKNVIGYDGNSLIGFQKDDFESEFCTPVLTNLFVKAKAFESDLLVWKEWSENLCHYRILSKEEQFWDSITKFTREFYDCCGLKKATVHMSGGIDSAIVGAIALEAFGDENVHFMTNPSKEHTSKETLNVVDYINDHWNVDIKEYPISGLYKEFQNQWYKADNDLTGGSEFGELSAVALAGVEATLRTVIGLAYSKSVGLPAGILCTANHTEIVLGWASFHDIGSIGALAPIGDLTKVELFALAKWISEHTRYSIPECLYNGELLPAAELADSKEDPFDYFVMSGICAMFIRDRASSYDIVQKFVEQKLPKDYFPIGWDGKDIYERIDLNGFKKEVVRAKKLMQHSIFKAAQGAPVLILSPRSRGFSNRETIINFYDRL